MNALRIISLARRIVTQCVRDKRTLGLIIIVPSIVMALLGYFYTTNTGSMVTLGVADSDAGLGGLNLAGDVVSALGQQGNLTLVYLNAADINGSIKDKKIDGAIVFGEDFTKDVVLNHTVNAKIVTEGTDQGKSAAVGMKARNATVSAITNAIQDLGGYNVNVNLPAVTVNGSAAGAPMRVGVQNNDEGLDGIRLSDRLVGELQGESNLTIVALGSGDINQSLRSNNLSAAIVIGPGFTRDVYESHDVNVSVAALFDPRNASMYQQSLSMVGGKLQDAMAASLEDFMKGGSLSVNVGTEVVYGDGFKMLDLFAPYLLGVIAFAFIFIFTGVTFLRERSFGTFERLLVSPITRSEIILGYVLGFSVFAVIQSMIILLFAVFVLNVKIVGNIYDVVALQLLITLVSVNLGIFCSSFAKNEFQAVQFIPLLILPQIFLDGMFWPISTLPNYLQVFSYVMPLTYANDALQNIMVRGLGIGSVWIDVAVLLAFAVAMIGLSALSINKSLQ
ncbi:MAG TPA: ABC transporter permease [Methanocellaceae archaeon]